MNRLTCHSKLNLFFLSIITLFSSTTLVAQAKNYALQFDGIDDEIDIFMDVIPTWSIEAWVKGNDSNWNADEVIVGNGWVYPVGEIWEDYPLLLKDGHLSAFRSKLVAPVPLSGEWHHLASTCDGRRTKLYIDGIEVASSPIAKPTAPNFIGSDDGKEHFCGLIDEVRIWDRALTAKEIKAWKNKPIDPTHPSYSSLLAYYTFDDQANDATDLMLKNTGDIKNADYYNPAANDPIYVLNDNPIFRTPTKNMELLNADVIQNSWTVENRKSEVQIIKLRLSTQGSKNALQLNQLTLDLSGTTTLADISKVHIYYLGNTPDSKHKTELFGQGISPAKSMAFTAATGMAQTLTPGLNYIEITFDLKEGSLVGHHLDAAISSFQLNNTSYQPNPAAPSGAREIISGKDDPNSIKALVFNIWHGGREGGYRLGVKRTIEIIKESKADIVFMIESYGAQQEISDSLGYFLYTKHPKANLSIHSRYPIVDTFTSNYSSFKAIGAKLRLSNQREVIVYDIWLRYSKPDYSTEYRSPQAKPADWVKGDLKTTMPDIKGIFEQDIEVNATDPTIPVIIGGDFNSASHLDWTVDTAPLHGGIGAVAWPVHKYMIDEKGYTDSYRSVHPNPLTHQGSTWAAIFNWSNHLRIDYIYHKGPQLSPIASTVIDTHPNIGVMWPGDHAAVLTTYKLEFP